MPNNFAPKRRHKTENKNKQKKERKKIPVQPVAPPPKLLQNKSPKTSQCRTLTSREWKSLKKKNKSDGTKNLSLEGEEVLSQRGLVTTATPSKNLSNDIIKYLVFHREDFNHQVSNCKLAKWRNLDSRHRSVFRVFSRFSLRRDETLDSRFHPPLKYQRVVTGLAPNSHQGPSLTAVANLRYRH